MLYEVFKQLVLDSTVATLEVSPAIAMADFDAAQISIVLRRLTATNVDVKLQESNDKNNWRNVSGATETVSAEGYFLGTKRTGRATTWLRMCATLTGTGMAVVSVDLNLSKQQ